MKYAIQEVGISSYVETSMQNNKQTSLKAVYTVHITKNMAKSFH